ncbi:sterol desaturase family protein [Dongia sedimenti]|uniref:Sterol desaturase family protein n=1 Tax=Dongia sedimenti TaxID=3064282 RepID=A0ABU0YU82_9PROT|nr:sterol desaturase family protein [Rhodospirillaceae bacterium R-7]
MMEIEILDAVRPHGGLSLIVLLLVIAEFTWLRFGERSGDSARNYDLRESAATGAILVGQLLMRSLTAFVLAPVYFRVAEHAIMRIEMSSALSWVALLLVVDLAYYWFHRLSHQVAWLWATHAVHHSSTRFNLSAAYRLGWTNLISLGWLFFLVPILIGFPPAAVAGMLSANLTYQIFLHTCVVGRLGPLEWVFNTPAHHRVHHAVNESCRDRNFGGVLIVFDRLFGTFAEAPHGETLRYGTVDTLAGYNPFAIAFSGWLRLIERARAARSFAGVLRVTLGRPR